MKRLFKKNYLWAIVAAVFLVTLFAPALPTQAQLIDNLGPLPTATAEGTKPDKTQINKARDELCGKSSDCKTGFNEVINNGQANVAAVCGQTGTAGVNRAVNEYDKPYCAAGAMIAAVAIDDFNNLTKSGGPCSAPMAADAIKSCMNGYYRGLRGLSNNCGGANKNKCVEAFNKGKSANSSAKLQITSAKNTVDNSSAAGGSGGTTGEPDIECSDSDALSWITCPIIESISTVIEQMDSAINNLLTVDTNKLFGTGDASENDQKVSNAYYKAWSVFRTFALGFVVIMALIVIISTAFGYEILDAYTIRKVLPRLLIAIIGITLSWSILSFLIGLTNDIGNGIRAVIYAPFNGLDLGGSNGNINFEDGIGPILSVLGVGTVVVMTSMGVLAMAGVALIAVICAFLVLVVRELIIIILVITAPIGIAMLILPNTRKFWQFWQTTLAAMLIAFPFISAMIATGKVFSMVTLSFDDNDLIYNMVALVAYIIPYFMLPFAFKFAGGVLGTISGGLGARAGGLSGGLSKYAAGRRQQSLQGIKNGTRYSETGRFTGGAARRFNRTTGGLSTGLKGGFGVPITERGRASLSQLDERNALENVMKNPNWNTVNNNDDALRAMTYKTSGEAMARLTASKANGGLGWDENRASAAVAAARNSVGFGRGQQVAAARQLVSTGTGYDNIDDMTEVLGRVSEGNSGTASSLAGFANSETKRVGRGDLAPSYNTLNAAVQNAGDTRYAAGGSAATSQLGRQVQKSSANKNDLVQKSWESVSLYQHGNGKPAAIQNFAKHYEEKLRTGTQEEKVQALTFFQDLKNMQNGANGAVSSEIDTVLGRNQDVIQQASSADASSMQRDVMDASGNVTKQAYTRSVPPPRGQEGPANIRTATLGEIASTRARSYRDPNIADRE